MKKKPTSFLDLPGEIRNQIYSLTILPQDREGMHWLFPFIFEIGSPFRNESLRYQDFDLFRYSSVPRWLRLHQLAKIHPQISREWASIITNSSCFGLYHDTKFEIRDLLAFGNFFGRAFARVRKLKRRFLAKKDRRVHTAEDASKAWRIWIRNLKEDQAISIRELWFGFRHLHQSLDVSVFVDENGQVHTIQVRLEQPLYLDRVVSKSKADEKLKAIGEALSLDNLKHLNLTRKQVLSKIFWEIFQFQIWAYPEYLVWLERHEVTDKGYLDWLEKLNLPCGTLSEVWEKRIFSLTWARQ